MGSCSTQAHGLVEAYGRYCWRVGGADDLRLAPFHLLACGGMALKPAGGLARGRCGLLQPAIKCRGREYLRIIYGPEYTEPRNLERLRARGLRAKQSLALCEYALGLEALHRFIEYKPLHRVHECVFGVLALESEPVDARL